VKETFFSNQKFYGYKKRQFFFSLFSRGGGGEIIRNFRYCINLSRDGKKTEILLVNRHEEKKIENFIKDNFGV
jgi:hypothetical protein